MFKQSLTLGAIGMVCSVAAASANNTPITGNVSSKCSIFTDTAGVYGNPTPDELSTLTADGGVLPVVRYDVSVADKYTAKISWPNSFSTSPNLSDSITWDGETEVKSHSDAGMSAFETGKIEYNNTVEFDLTIAGSVWFDVASTADYGYDKSFPAGDYTAMVTAECIAQ